MRVSRYGTWVVFLTIAAMLLAVYAFSLPWYRLARNDNYAIYTYYGEVEEINVQGQIRFVGYDSFGLPSAQGLMSTLSVFILLYVLASLVWIEAVLVHARRRSLVIGMASLALAVAAPAYFALNSSNLLWEAREMRLQTTFSGSAADAAGYIWNMGPGMAWYCLIAAWIIQLVAYAVRSYDILADLEP